MPEYKDVLRVCDVKSAVATALRERMVGFTTDTYELAVKAPGGTMYYFAANGIDHYTNLYIDESIIHYGNDGMKINFAGDDILNIYLNNLAAMQLDYNAAQKIITINGDEVDVDLLVKDDNGRKAFFIQGDYGYIGFGTDTPAGVIDIAYQAYCSSVLPYLLFSSSYIEHGITDELPTNAFGGVKINDWANGGLVIKGINEGGYPNALTLYGIRCTDDSPTSAPVCLKGAKKSGTGVTDVGNTHDLLTLYNNASVKLTVRGNGDVILTGDILTTDWTNYAASSTIGGFSVVSDKYIWYKLRGKQLTVRFFISGTSNSTSFTFTLPFTSPAEQFKQYEGTIRFHDNSADSASPGLLTYNYNSNTVQLFTTFSGGAWTASNFKYALGSMVCEIA